MGQGADGPPELSAEECVRAGMYWFGKSDFAAAEAWWKKALDLEPGNARALQCLKLLGGGAWSNPAPPPEPPQVESPAVTLPIQDVDVDIEAPEEAPTGRPGADGSAARPSPFLESLVAVGSPKGPSAESWGDAVGGADASAVSMGWDETSTRGTAGGPDPLDDIEVEIPTDFADEAPEGSFTDPLDFAIESQRPISRPNVPWSDRSPTPSPWNEGPSKTSVVTLRDDGGYDAVPEPSPMPELNRERFFGRETLDAELAHYLAATGDLAVARERDSAEEILISEPVEASQDLGTGALEPRTYEEILHDARDRFALHDFNGVLDRIERLSTEEQTRQEIRELAAAAKANLLKMYESKIGDFEQAPRRVISTEEVIWLNLNHRAGFILSQVDGNVTYEDLIALSGMPRLDTLRILAQLLEQRVIE